MILHEISGNKEFINALFVCEGHQWIVFYKFDSYWINQDRWWDFLIFEDCEKGQMAVPLHPQTRIHI